MKKLFFLIGFLFSLPLASLLLASPASVQTYDELIHAIREVRHQSEARIEQAVQQEKVREAWETGKLIDEHVLFHKERADYGKQVIDRLASDLATSDDELYRMLRFYRIYPKVAPAQQLTWSDYKDLLSLSDDQERREVAEKASKENWTRNQIREEVQKRKAARGEREREAKPGTALISAKLGKIGTYRLVKATLGPEIGKLVIDLGFSNYYKTSKDLRFKEGAIIETTFVNEETGSSPTDKIKASKRTADDLFTYKIYVTRILDGDTIKAVIDLGFGVRSVQTLRLHRLDAPEIISAEGKKAKAFLEKELKEGPVLIRSVKSDKYDRYLADIFVKGAYINQKLINEGLAIEMKD